MGTNIPKHRDSLWHQITPALIPAGDYLIGSNSIPNASPPHNREVRSFWIDRTVVTFGHFERFVVGGGYDDESLWSDSDNFTTLLSVDQRCEELMEHSHQVSELFRDRPVRSCDIPLVGISWSEAAAIARFARARLPFEIEWEIAMQRSSHTSKELHNNMQSTMFPFCWNDTPRSDWGCVVATTLQEWTADAYSPRYWRADCDRHGTFWTPAQTYGVSLRGACTSDIYKDHRFRRAADPKEVHSARGFRRVWESQPTAAESSCNFVQM